jgi:V/A-type H+/Na+-transporting ATPase subunit A
LRTGNIIRVSGSVVVVTGIRDVQLGEIVEVGDEGLIGEVIWASANDFTAQIYEPTTGLKPLETVVATGKKLAAELGPGLIANVLDGIGRPLDSILSQKGPFLSRGIKANTLSRNKQWYFDPLVKVGQSVGEGDILGEVKESRMVPHKVMVPSGIRGTVAEVKKGNFTVDETVALLENGKQEAQITMMHEWPIRSPRPFGHRLSLEKPLITGQRVIDVFFPISKGGAACIPGGFGTGKTVMLHQMAKWSDADIIVYIGCGERGNEISDLIADFPKLKDPYTGLPLIEKTILIANTSNMAVAAREASIYVGITIAEYYRDMGYNVALMADSTSRWAEALREISGRLEEMPSERGYPAYLPDRIAGFYERAGRVETLGKPDREGSLTVIGAVSPPGGDFNEPVTIDTLRFTGVFWALDAELAYSRHFPAVNWLRSHSLYRRQLTASWAESLSQHSKEVEKWWGEKVPGFAQLRSAALDLLSESAEIESIAKIIGESALPDDQRLILATAELLKEGFLRQNAYGDADSYCPPYRQVLLLEMMLDFFQNAKVLVDKGVKAERIVGLPIITKMKRIKEATDGEKAILGLGQEVHAELNNIGKDVGIEFRNGVVSVASST